jgi:hypothetical protein
LVLLLSNNSFLFYRCLFLTLSADRKRVVTKCSIWKHWHTGTKNTSKN